MPYIQIDGDHEATLMKTSTKWFPARSWILLALGMFQLAAACGTEKPLKLVSYNILNGMKLDESKGKAAFVSWLKSLDADIVGLQEAQELTQQSLEEMARRFGHPYAVLLKLDGYPTALTSKYPIVNVRKVTDNLHHGFIQAEIQGFNVIVLHFSPHKYWKRREEVDLVLATIGSEPQKLKRILMGDFNAESPLDRDMYADGRLAIARRRAEERYATHENLVDGKLDFDVISRLLDSGFIDVVHREQKGPMSSQPTRHFMGVEDRNVPRRVDYIFVSPDLEKSVVAARIVKDAFTDVHSDHYPVSLELSATLRLK